MKYVEDSRVIRQEQLSDGIFSLLLQTEKIAAEAAPGQFVLLWCSDGSRILPRPISICSASPADGTLRLVYRVTGKETGTEEFSRLQEGDSLRIEGPLGNGFDMDLPEEEHLLIVGGGIGIPPMLWVAEAAGCRKAVVLGYRSTPFMEEDFKERTEKNDLWIATEDGTCGTRGNVLDVIRGQGISADRIYTCGPKPMLHFLAAWAEENGIPCFVSMEERMACGSGACLACVCRTKETDSHTNVRNRRVCKEGPVFRSTEVEI